MSNVAWSANTSPLQADIVLEGGGVRGIGHVGALSVLEEKGHHWVNIAGTSAGAFVAALMAANYSSQEMYDIMRNDIFHADKATDDAAARLAARGVDAGKIAAFRAEAARAQTPQQVQLIESKY